MVAEVDQRLPATWHTDRAHLSGVLCYVGPTWVKWSNRGLTCGKLGAKMDSYCAAMCQLGFDSLLMWDVVAVPCGIGWARWLAVAVPCGIGWVRWPCYGLPRGTPVGPTYQVLTPAWGSLADVDQ
jgi:hypothetical protein